VWCDPSEIPARGFQIMIVAHGAGLAQTAHLVVTQEPQGSPHPKLRVFADEAHGAQNLFEILFRVWPRPLVTMQNSSAPRCSASRAWRRISSAPSNG
jgi:hypothetical protein